jgi:pyruvate,water dikinase
LLNKKIIIKKHKVDKETKFLIRLSDSIAPPHDRRKELFLRTVYTLDGMREEIAKRYGYTKQELEAFEVQDILKLKEGKNLDKEYGKKLSEQGLIYINTEKNVWKYYHGEEAQDFFDKKYSPELNNIKELKGMAASLGKVTGIVKVINGFKDAHKMEKGNILVSSMTRPELVPAMRKASAIITNEGGVTCHAAIISRELGIPCIIGTKFATRIFKDGDLVEVDADKGIVKLIK